MTTGHRLLCKEFLCFNTMPSRHTPLLCALLTGAAGALHGPHLQHHGQVALDHGRRLRGGAHQGYILLLVVVVVLLLLLLVLVLSLLLLLLLILFSNTSIIITTIRVHQGAVQRAHLRRRPEQHPRRLDPRRLRGLHQRCRPHYNIRI